MLLLLLASCVRVGSSPLDSQLPQGIGGLIGRGADDRRYPALLEEAWTGFHATDAAFDDLLSWPPMGWATASRDMSTRLEASRALEEALVGVVRIGAAEPGLAALTRIGQMYEAEQAWLRAEPRVAPVFRSKGWAGIYPVLRVFAPRVPAPYPPRPTGWSAGCPVEPATQRARAAYELAVSKADELGLLADPNRAFALARLEALDPDGHPRRWEWVPGDPARPEAGP